MAERLVAVALIFSLAACTPAQLGTESGELERLAAAPHRSARNVARDGARHPVEVLKFFGVQPQHTVVEILPGSAGYYMEILAPYLKEKGRYIAADRDATAPPQYLADNRRLRARIAAEPALYGKVVVTEFDADRHEIAPPGSADVVLTFRNLHNWLDGGYADDAFKQFYAALKPGGILGVVEHRAKPGTSLEHMQSSGYVTEAKAVELATAAGFELVSRSEINANPKDTADHPKGVWTLPPSLRLGDKDREKYLAIGESDRMTLKFRKPTLKEPAR